MIYFIKTFIYLQVQVIYGDIEMEKQITVKRVSYSSNNTPPELREYRIMNMSECPVGTLSEWKEFAMTHGFEQIKVIEKNGFTKIMEV